jgi:hypothetical protein
LLSGISQEVSSTTSSSSYAWIPISVPNNADYISFDILFQGLSPNDYFNLGIDDTPLFVIDNQYLSNNNINNSGLINISKWKGQDIDLVFGLNASDDNNLGGTININNIQFYSVPEPSSVCIIGFSLMYLAMRRKPQREYNKRYIKS